MYRMLLTLAFLLALPWHALAHGTDKNVMGTTTEVATDHLVVRTTDGHEVRVTVRPETKFLKDHSPSSAAELKNGSRVVVELDGAGEKAFAAEVHFSSASPRSGAAGAPAASESSAHGDPKN